MGFIRGVGEFLAAIAGFMLVWSSYHHFLSLENMVQMNNITYRFKQLMWSVVGGFISLLIAASYLEPSPPVNSKQNNKSQNQTEEISSKSPIEIPLPIDLGNANKTNVQNEHRETESEPSTSSEK